MSKLLGHKSNVVSSRMLRGSSLYDAMFKPSEAKGPAAKNATSANSKKTKYVRTKPNPGLIPDGSRYGKLLVLEYAYTYKKKRFYNVQCDCGASKTMLGITIRNSKSQSCGCTRTEAQNKLKLPDEIAMARIIKHSYLCGAERRGLIFDLTFEKFFKIIKSNCDYCGIEPCNSQKKKGKERFFFNGVDRIDSNIGYVLGNVVAACGTCNIAKKNATREDFIAWAMKLVDYQRSSEYKSKTDWL